MLGIKTISSGRMGNRLFHYHFLRQVARKTGIEYFHPELPDSIYFEEMEKRRKPLFRYKKTIEITSRDILSFKTEELLNFIADKNDNGIDIVFSPPILGEVFFDYLFFPPNEFIKVRNEYKVGFEPDTKDKTVIGLHFRGTDFPAWNKNAVLEFGYYEAAVNYCLEYFRDRKVCFALFTDDREFSSYRDTVNFLKAIKGANLYFGDKDNSAIYDFYKMTQCDVLISSPSTFAIFGGCLGKRKKIIHSKKWLDYAIERNDTFWVRLSKSDSPYYSLWRAF